MRITDVDATSSAAGQEAAGDGRGGAFGGSGLLADLLVASGRRDEAAFARFYQLTSPWIIYLLGRSTTLTAHAEEATSLVYTTAWRRAASFRPAEQSALAWVTRIAYGVVAP